jgi:nitrite reductase/ring-hydroxylating ferredoxin subunit
MAEVTEALSGETPVACGASCACGTGQVDEGRREFLKQSAAGLALLALAACGLGTATAPGSLSATTIQLSSEPALANVGGVATMQIGGSPVAVVRESATSFSAFSLICPHAGSTVQSIGAPGFLCPGHGARFDLSGQWIGGQRTSNLRSYPVTYDAAAGTLTIGG